MKILELVLVLPSNYNIIYKNLDCVKLKIYIYQSFTHIHVLIF